LATVREVSDLGFSALLARVPPVKLTGNVLVVSALGSSSLRIQPKRPSLLLHLIFIRILNCRKTLAWEYERSVLSNPSHFAASSPKRISLTRTPLQKEFMLFSYSRLPVHPKSIHPHIAKKSSSYLQTRKRGKCFPHSETSTYSQLRLASINTFVEPHSRRAPLQLIVHASSAETDNLSTFSQF
jgi:hypothetical protein